jgi:hypothetical protein
MLRMFRMFRRLIRLAMLVAAAYTAYTRWAQRGTSARPSAGPMTPWSPASTTHPDAVPGPASASPDVVQVATDRIAPATIDPPSGENAAENWSDTENESAN